MSRPLYETQADRDAELEAADVLAQKWNCELLKTGPKYTFDFFAMRGKKPYALVEFKKRTNPANQYPTYMISLFKISQTACASEFLGLPFLVVVQFTDRMMYWKYERGQYTIEVGGRTDRNDAMDVEPVIHIDMSDFKAVT